MNSFVYTPYTFLLAVSTLVTLILGVVIWRRRPGAGVYPMVILLAAMTLWTLCYNLEISAVGMTAKRLLAGAQYIGIGIVPAAWFAFTLEYTGREKWLTRRNLLLLALWPLIISLFALFNMQHTLLYVDARLLDFGTFTLLETDKGPLFAAHVVVSYGLLGSATVLLVRTLLRSPDIYRGQIVGLLIGTFTPWIANVLYVTGLDPIPGLDLTPSAFVIAASAFSYSMLRYRLMDIVPVARDIVIEGMGDAMLVINTAGIIEDLNMAARHLLIGRYDTLVSKPKLIGRPAREVLSSYQEAAERYRDVESAQTEIDIETPDGKRYFDLRIAPMYNRSGNLTGRVVTLHDITDFRNANARISAQNEVLTRTNQALSEARKRAEDANRLKSEFLATMSHELRTPLNAIIGFSDLMITGIAGEMSPQQKDYVQRVLSNSERLLALINELLDVSKIEAGRMELVTHPLKPADLLHRLHQQLLPLAEKKGLRLETGVDSALPERLLGDEKRLEQIITNLVTNAIRFTDTGHVTARLQQLDEAHWGILVSDTGVGIPPHAQEYIFDEFRQVDGSTQRQHSGTGLGLAVVRKLAQLMDGSVAVTSEVGHGSTFTVRLPIKHVEAPAPASQTAPDEEAAP
jgi:signal transduction histidine kinase